MAERASLEHCEGYTPNVGFDFWVGGSWAVIVGDGPVTLHSVIWRPLIAPGLGYVAELNTACITASWVAI